MTTTLLTLLISIATPAWPQFRGPLGNGMNTSATPPVKWSENENIRWKTPIHDKGWSSPVVWDTQIWLTTAKADGKEFFALCIDRATGKILHDVSLFTESDPAFCHAFNSYASPTPAIEQGRVYCHFGSHGTVCLDTATAKPVWTRRDLKCDHFRGPGSSPVIHKNKLILTFDGHDVQYVCALDKLTGETLWKIDRKIIFKKTDGDFHKGYGTPCITTINGQVQLISPAADTTIAYDPDTGKELWRIFTDGMNQSIVPIHAHGLVYLSAGHKSELLAVKAGKTGTLAATDIAWTMKKEAPTRPSILAIDQLLYMVNDKAICTCLDAKTGKSLWRERLDGEFSASPVSNGKLLIFPNENGKTFVLEAGDEYKPASVNKLDAGCMASPAILGDALYLRTKTHLYCIGVTK